MRVSISWTSFIGFRCDEDNAVIEGVACEKKEGRKGTGIGGRKEDEEEEGCPRGGRWALGRVTAASECSLAL